MLNPQIIDKAISADVSFAVVALPGTTRQRIFTTPADNDTSRLKQTGVSIAPWLARWESRLTMPIEIDAAQLDAAASSNSGKPGHTPWPHAGSTSHAAYIENVSRVIESCRKRNGKTVYSRTTSADMKPGITPGTIYNDICEKFPDTCRFIFHTPATGTWTGATPELLLDYNRQSRQCRVMSLAGTRPQNTPLPWDKKNLLENRFVSDFIVDTFRDFGIQPSTGPITTLPYGNNIEHLRRDITAVWRNDLPVEQLIDALNPTPALCGTPRQNAIADITDHETHNRGCYGGIIALESAEAMKIYVILRCCHISGNRLTAISGGGITPDSDPEAEWRESTAKASVFNRYTS